MRAAFALVLGAFALLAAAPAPPLSPAVPPAIPPPDSIAGATAALAAPADTTKPKVYLRPSFQPAALWSASRGFGIAGGLGIRHLGWEGSEVEIAARLSQRFQSASVYLYTQDPYEAPVYGFVGGRVRASTRQRFYGLGPFSRKTNGLYLDYTAAQAEGRVGWYPFGHTGLLLQPGARLLWDHLADYERDDTEALQNLRADSVSLPNLDAVAGDTRYGLSLGLEVSRDTRDRLVMTRRGVLAEASLRRFFALDGSGLQFNSAQVRVFGFLPLMGRRVVGFARAVGAVTRADDDPDGTALPFFYRPALDDALLPGYAGERFFGRDLLAFGAGVRFPFIDLFGRYAIDGLVQVDVGSSYDDITAQFSPRVSLARNIAADADGRVPLRAGVGFGLNFVNIDRDRSVFGLMVGLSPESLTLTGLTIVYDFRDLRPLFR